MALHASSGPIRAEHSLHEPCLRCHLNREQPFVGAARPDATVSGLAERSVSAFLLRADRYASMSGYGKAVRARVIGLDRAWWCTGGHGEGSAAGVRGMFWGR